MKVENNWRGAQETIAVIQTRQDLVWTNVNGEDNEQTGARECRPEAAEFW